MPRSVVITRDHGRVAVGPLDGVSDALACGSGIASTVAWTVTLGTAPSPRSVEILSCRSIFPVASPAWNVTGSTCTVAAASFVGHVTQPSAQDTPVTQNGRFARTTTFFVTARPGCTEPRARSCGLTVNHRLPIERKAEA